MLRNGGSRADHQPSAGIASAGYAAPEAERPLRTETHGSMAAIGELIAYAGRFRSWGGKPSFGAIGLPFGFLLAGAGPSIRLASI